jgi:hypothetical protein
MILTLLTSFAAPTLVQAAAEANPIVVSIERQADGSQCVMGRFMINEPLPIVWETLSSYDDLASFVPSVKHSQTVRKSDHKVYVEQTMVGQAGFMRKTILLLLEIVETPQLKLEFRDVKSKSFKLYEGSWELAQWDNGVVVTYHLTAVPNFFAPDFITGGIFKKSVQDLLGNVRDEIFRRSQSGATPTKPA